MNVAELFKKNFVLVPIIASVIVGGFTSVKYVVNLTDTINGNKTAITQILAVEVNDLKRELKIEQDKVEDLKIRLSSAEATWQMAENLYRALADQVREHSYDIKDLNR
jgi:hypothetical protein|tara:strand:- start:29 stop:352 length:324 start_codon:yes stop_codon:yes gene_type:complete